MRCDLMDVSKADFYLRLHPAALVRGESLHSEVGVGIQSKCKVIFHFTIHNFFLLFFVAK